MSRYAIYESSMNNHCCFEFTVVDTEKPTMLGDEHYRHWRTGELMYEAVCECYTREDAELICNALNASAVRVVSDADVSRAAKTLKARLNSQAKIVLSLDKCRDAILSALSRLRSN